VALLAHRDRGSILAHPTSYVFAKADGSPLEGTSVTKAFQRLLRTAGLPRLTFHGLRHSCASLLLAQGVSAKVIQETLGHSTIATTMDVYAHLMPSLRQDAADAMDRVLGGQ
jgi:integrase